MLIDWNAVQSHKLPEKMECFSRSEIEQIISALQKRCHIGYMRRNDGLPRSCLIGNNGQIYVLGKGNSTEKIYTCLNRTTRWGLCLNTMQLTIVKTSCFVGSIAKARNEIELLKRVRRDPLFVQFLDSVEYPSKKNRMETKITVITERCNLGDLIDVYKKHHAEIPKVFPFLFQVLSRLESLKILHRDLKGDNIFVHKGENGISFKLGDFGLAGTQEDELIRCRNIEEKMAGTFPYISPEVCSFAGVLDITDEEVQEVCSYSTDVWSAGVLIFQLMFGETLLPDNAEEMERLTQKPIDDFLNENLDKVWFKKLMDPREFTLLCECLQGMLRIDPEERLTGQQLVEKYHVN